jgi:uncharacterized membrane protein YccC
MIPSDTSGPLSTVLSGVVKVDRAKLVPLAATRCALGLAIPLVVGYLTGHLLFGVTASIGALTGGFASLQGAYRTRAGTVVVATLGMALSAFVGSNIGHVVIADIAVTAAWGFVAGMLVALGPAATIVGLQSVVGLVVFAQFRFSPAEALLQGGLVLAGGLLQTVLVVASWPLGRFGAERRTLSQAYGRLAAHARSLASSPTSMLEPDALEDLSANEHDPQPFGSPAEAAGYQALRDEADRIRLELASLARYRQRLSSSHSGLPPEAEAADALDLLALAASRVLAETAGALRPGGWRAKRQPPGLPGASLTDATPGTGTAGTATDQLTAALRLIEASCAGVIVHGDQRSLALVEPARDSANALAGQLRAAARLAAPRSGGQDRGSGTSGAGSGTVPDWRGLPGALGSADPPEPGRMPSERQGRRHFAGLFLAGRRAGGQVEALRANMTWASQAFRHALRLAVSLGIAVALSHLTPLGHGYWLPLTVMIVLKPDFATTFTRGIARSIGTLVGAGLVTALVAGLRPGPVGLVILTIALYWAAVTILAANYAVFSMFIASLVVVLLAFLGEPELALAGERSFYTVAGALLALGAYAAWPTWERSVLPDRLAALVEADGRYGRAVLSAWAAPEATDVAALQQARLAARLARTNAEASVARWLAEPAGHGQLGPEVVSGILAAVRRFVQGTLALHSELPANGSPLPALDTLADEVDEALGAVGAALRTGEGNGWLPRLRDRQLELAANLPSANGATQVLASETDLIVDAVDTLGHLVGLKHAPWSTGSQGAPPADPHLDE